MTFALVTLLLEILCYVTLRYITYVVLYYLYAFLTL